ncbi:Hypothetical predicted protein [Mytilus galloprovincialis]|uniref:Integrase p58-like C-terminal domain-containing protein n=1 Tax=Mytilus galloprovincialis TaxID=29158 RepID=A0A8B6CPV2_MYTGA|nr:Hypothetical predicted protein [Mytilus galloprovincialis]
MIRCFTKKRQDSWDVHLQQLTGAIRATENRQTGFTPNFMVFGKENIQPIDLVLGLDAPNRTREQKELTDYIKILRETLTEVHVLARENIKMAQWRQKRDYDLNVNCKVYKVGDTVFKIDSARKVGVCPKLKAPWKGPFVVAEVKSPVLYKIRNKKTSEVVHHDRLKLSQIRDLPIWTQRLKKRILENVERKMLEDLTDKEEHCDLGLDWLFSNNEPMLWNMMDSSLAQSDSLTGVKQYWNWAVRFSD